MQCVRWQDTMASQSHRINSKRWRRIERGRRGKRRGAVGKKENSEQNNEERKDLFHNQMRIKWVQ